MPLYEYRCPACRARFELLQRMGECADAVRCPECGAAHVERQLSTFAAGHAGAMSFADTVGGCGRPQCGAGFT
ncbi:MAG TPA: zinc ribbon domain-containing protein [Thermoanaerobaculia bacterium]|jgi:putative FmdB family regulatory protein